MKYFVIKNALTVALLTFVLVPCFSDEACVCDDPPGGGTSCESNQNAICRINEQGKCVCRCIANSPRSNKPADLISFVLSLGLNKEVGADRVLTKEYIDSSRSVLQSGLATDFETFRFASGKTKAVVSVPSNISIIFVQNKQNLLDFAAEHQINVSQPFGLLNHQMESEFSTRTKSKS